VPQGVAARRHGGEALEAPAPVLAVRFRATIAVVNARSGPPPKSDVARALLLRGSVFVHLDPRDEDVCVPAWLRQQPQLVLQIGLDMPIPIPDLRVDGEGIVGTLSFQRTPFTCVVPWKAVFALLDEAGKGMLWPESLPPEIAAEVASEVERATRPKRPRPDRSGPEGGARRGPPRRGGAGGPEPSPARAARGRARTQPAPLEAAPLPGDARAPEGPVGGPEAPGAAPESPPPRASGTRPALRALDGQGGGQGRRGGAAGAARKSTGERPAWLRVVK
jgi:hypothetical protein